MSDVVSFLLPSCFPSKIAIFGFVFATYHLDLARLIYTPRYVSYAYVRSSAHHRLFPSFPIRLCFQHIPPSHILALPSAYPSLNQRISVAQVSGPMRSLPTSKPDIISIGQRSKTSIVRVFVVLVVVVSSTYYSSSLSTSFSPG